MSAADKLNKKIPMGVGPGVQKLNPQLFNSGGEDDAEHDFIAALSGCGVAKGPHVEKAKKRIRQDSKPLLNKLETEWFEVLKVRLPNYRVIPQGVRLKLANGAWYKPDFAMVSHTGGITNCWEVKGPKAWRGGFEFLKIAAHQWPEICFVLVWKRDGKWVEQEVLP
jgi:hypothetical protein